MIFAEASTGGLTATQIGLGVMFLLLAAAGVKTVWDLVDRMLGKKQQISPQPLEIRAAVEFVKQSEFRAAHEHFEQRDDHLEKQLAAMRVERIQDVKDAALSRKGIYDKLDSMRRELSTEAQQVRREIPELERRISAAGEERITKVHDRINDVLEAVSELRGEVKRGKA
jgi:hypothetical protein